MRPKQDVRQHQIDLAVVCLNAAKARIVCPHCSDQANPQTPFTILVEARMDTARLRKALRTLEMGNLPVKRLAQALLNKPICLSRARGA